MKGRRSRIGRASPSDAVPNPQRRRNNARHSHPKAPRRQSRRSNTRQDIRTNVRRRPSTSPSPSGTANPNAHRRHSRRSCIRPDKRANVRRRLSTNPSPSGTATQKRTGGIAAAAIARLKQPHPRETKAQTTRTRQRRAALAAQTAVGDAQERILLRDDHLANTASVRFHRTSKSAFLFGGPGTFLFGKHKKKCPRNSPPPYKRRPLNIPDIYFIIFFNL